MSEAEGGPSPMEMLYQQMVILTQAVTRLQEGQTQLEGRVLQMANPTERALPSSEGGSHQDQQAAAPGPPSASAGLAPEPRVPLPERFAGDRRRFRAFKDSCLLYFSLQPRTFATEETKVGLVISLLLEQPQSWAHRLRDQRSPCLSTLSAFFTAMALLYDDPLRATTAEATLHALRQGRRPVEDYIADFRNWATDSAWNDAALKFQFRLGLTEQLKDELARVETPSTLEALILLATQLDRRLRERRSERGAAYSFPGQASPGPLTTDMGDEEPMQLGLLRPSLSPEERLRRRRANLCLYCGASGHFLQDCHVRPGKPRQTVFASMLATSMLPSRLTLLISLQVAGKDLPVQAIVDSGACHCFMDLDWARRHQVPSLPKTPALHIRLADGSTPSSGPITRETPLIPIRTDSGHQDSVCFALLRSPMFPVILGMPWLKTHNPRIQWDLGEIQLNSDYCSKHCYPSCNSQLPPGSSVLCLQNTTDSTPSLPAAYQEFSDVFDEQQAEHLPPHRSYDCPVELLPGAKIPFGRIYPLSEPELETLRKYVEDNLRKGFIRPSSSPAGAGIFFVEKKDRSLRPCVDYRELNKITIKNRYPLPLVPELFQRLRSARVFTKLDLRGAYNLVRIREGDEWKTAFRTRFGHFEYLVMPFGLCNAPATFQHLINDVMREFLDVFVIAYLDDILIFSNSLPEHRLHVKQVLMVLRKNRLFAKLEKCQFEVSTIQFLGLVLSRDGIAMDPQKVSAILNWPIPDNKKAVQRFIGFANFYRRFIKDFSAIIAPITRLTRQDTRFHWPTAAQTAFEDLKSLFTSAPVLQHPDPTLPYVLEVDASENAVGAVLSQRQGTKALLHPVAFFSRKLASSERNYDVGDRELLAIKTALEEWRYLLEGSLHPILIFTDHKNLEYLRTAKCLRPRQARWALFFSRFDFHITYRPGSKNVKPDALSRMFPEGDKPQAPDTILAAHNFCLLQPDLLTMLKTTPIPESERQALALQPREGLSWHGGKIFVPGVARARVMGACHDSPLAGHFGTHKTVELIRRSFWWPTLEKDCHSYVSTCHTCQRNKTRKGKPWGLLKPLPIPKRPWEMISIDFIVELAPSKGFSTICVVVDRLSKMAHFIPMQGTPTATETASVFIREIVRLHGLPGNVVSDRGAQFTSKFWDAFCRALKVKRCLSSTFHPQTNGQTERTNQTLEQYIRCFSTFLQDDWASLLPMAEFAYNNSVHSTTNQTPFWANYGFHPTFFPEDLPETAIPALHDQLQFFQTNCLLLREAMRNAQESHKKFCDRKRGGDLALQPGDKVWLATTNLRLDCPSKKLGPRFLGPFTIKRRINEVAFELALPRTFRIHPVFHVSLLKPAFPDPFPNRIKNPPPPIVVEGQEEFEVEEILDCRSYRGSTQYLVKWKGYGPEESSWEPVTNIHAPRALQAFKRQYPDRVPRRDIRRLPVGGGHCQDSAGTSTPVTRRGR